MGDNNLQLTSVKVDKSIYKRFRLHSIESNLTLKEVINRSLYLFDSDEVFRDRIISMDLEISGSKL